MGMTGACRIYFHGGYKVLVIGVWALAWEILYLPLSPELDLHLLSIRLSSVGVKYPMHAGTPDDSSIADFRITQLNCKTVY